MSQLEARGYYSGIAIPDSSDNDSGSSSETEMLTPARRAQDSRVLICSDSDADVSDEDEPLENTTNPSSMGVQELHQSLRDLGVSPAKIGNSPLVLRGLLRNALKTAPCRRLTKVDTNTTSSD